MSHAIDLDLVGSSVKVASEKSCLEVYGLSEFIFTPQLFLIL